MKVYRSALLVVIALLGIGCGNPDPVRIGYVAAITGRLSQLGIEGRNAVLMVVRERNEAGGVAGRTVELIVRDDESNPAVGVTVLNELIREVGVGAVIGPLTSNMIPAVESVRDAGVLVFSPIMSTVQLSGLDDHFVRANLTIERQAGILSEKMAQDGITRTSIVFDVSNPQYTEEFASEFLSAFRGRGGTVTMNYPFDSTADPDYVEIADAVIEDESPAVAFVAAGIDVGVIAQQLWKRNVERALYASEWAKTADIISVGGRAVEGMVFAGQYFPDEPPAEFERFSRHYQSLYGSTPDFAAQYAYETAVILLDAIDRAGTTELPELKRQIVGRTHKGLVEPIRIDAYGEATRTAAFARIENGRFIVEALDVESE